MIEELRLTVLFQGKTFSPREAEEATGLELANKIEAGEIATRGRYKGKPCPYGTGLLEVPDNIPYGERLLWLAKVLEGRLETIYKLGAEPTQIYAGYFYKDQCNFSFTQQEIEAVSNLNIELGISCYDVSDNEE